MLGLLYPHPPHLCTERDARASLCRHAEIRTRRGLQATDGGTACEGSEHGSDRLRVGQDQPEHYRVGVRAPHQQADFGHDGGHEALQMIAGQQLRTALWIENPVPFGPAPLSIMPVLAQDVRCL